MGREAGGALVVPLEDGHVWLVEQWRHPTRGRYGLLDQRVDAWLATGLEHGPRAPEPSEHDLRVGRFAFAELEAMIARGEIADAATVAAWHLVSRR